MEIITEKDTDIINKWFEDASKQTMETLPSFMAHVMCDYRHDYGTVCRAIAACAVAAAWAANDTPQGGITGFQAGAVMWGFIRAWNYRHNKAGLKITDYDDMLYPQYEEKFEKSISERVMCNLQEEAIKRLKDRDNMHPTVIAHMESIAAGNPPFGYKITD